MKKRTTLVKISFQAKQVCELQWDSIPMHLSWRKQISISWFILNSVLYSCFLQFSCCLPYCSADRLSVKVFVLLFSCSLYTVALSKFSVDLFSVSVALYSSDKFFVLSCLTKSFASQLFFKVQFICSTYFSVIELLFLKHCSAILLQ